MSVVIYVPGDKPNPAMERLAARLAVAERLAAAPPSSRPAVPMPRDRWAATTFTVVGTLLPTFQVAYGASEAGRAVRELAGSPGLVQRLAAREAVILGVARVAGGTAASAGILGLAFGALAWPAVAAMLVAGTAIGLGASLIDFRAQFGLATPGR